MKSTRLLELPEEKITLKTVVEELRLLHVELHITETRRKESVGHVMAE